MAAQPRPPQSLGNKCNSKIQAIPHANMSSSTSAARSFSPLGKNVPNRYCQKSSFRRNEMVFENVVYLLQCECCHKKYVGSTKTKFRQRFNVYKSYFRSYARKHNEGTLDRGETDSKGEFFSHLLKSNHHGKFDVTIKIIDGADNVFSLRRKELFWQYRLGTFLPRGLNERAADVELDMFACGMA